MDNGTYRTHGIALMGRGDMVATYLHAHHDLVWLG